MTRATVAACRMLPLLVLVACARQAPDGAAGIMSPEGVAEADRELRDRGILPPAPAARQAPQARKLVRTVHLVLVVAHTTAVAEGAQKLTARLGGYVASLRAERSQDLMLYSITLRVPAEQLDTALVELKRLAIRIDSEEQKTDDVTDQYVDLDARLRTLRSTEAELRALLAESRQRQRGAKEMMDVYHGLTDIRTQIEEFHGQLAVLDKLSALSTINLSLAVPDAARPVTAEGWQPMVTIRGSLRTLIKLVRGLGDFAIFAVIVLLPAAMALAAVLYLARRLRRKLRRREAAP